MGRTLDPGRMAESGWNALYRQKGRSVTGLCHEWLQVFDGQINAVPLSTDLSHAVGEPLILFRATDGLWAGAAAQRGGGTITDGPFLYRTKTGVLLMLWSGFVENGAYAVGYTRSASGDIQGPWIQKKNPLYALDAGHAMLFKTFGGDLMMSLHCPNDHSKKRILLFEMDDLVDQLAIANEVTGNWYNQMGGDGGRFRYKDPIEEGFVFRKEPRKA